MQQFINDKDILIQRATHILQLKSNHKNFSPLQEINFSTVSSVLFLLGKHPQTAHPCLILTKRSPKVRQPGDLCCPGGGIALRRDTLLSKILKLPLMPLVRWPQWKHWRRYNARAARTLALLLATGLRESFEEMRLNPMGVNFLGLLPPQSLVMFDRVIYPLVVWVKRQHRFYPNWEVEKIVHIPIRELLNAENYALYRLQMGTVSNPKQTLHARDFPCFCHKSRDETEVLWGATYQMTSVFLESVFDFDPPDFASLPVINGTLDENYLTGQR